MKKLLLTGAALGSFACVQNAPPKVAVPVAPAAAQTKPAPAAAENKPPAPPAPARAATAVRTPGVDRVLAVLGWLAAYDKNGRKSDQQKISFDFSEADVNDYCAWALQETPRPGIKSIKVAIHANNEISSTIVIDFDSLLRWNQSLIPAPMRPLLSGAREIRIDAQFQSKAGLVALTLQKASLADGTVIATPLTEAMIRLIALHQPELFDTNNSIQLPFGLQRIWTVNGQRLAGET